MVMTGSATGPRSEKVLELAAVKQSIHHIEACHYQPFCPMKHLTRNERSPRLLVYWMNRDESRGRGREAQALFRPAKEAANKPEARPILGGCSLAVIAGRILGGCAATGHILLSSRIDVVVFFPQISAVIRELSQAPKLVPENLYPVFREREMRPNSVRLPANSFAPDEALRTDLDALKMAKARQDVSHQKLDRWIATAIAELSDQKRAA
jgi:hypothetical protein